MEYMKRLLDVIKSVNHEGTYKLALARAILECLKNGEYEEFDEIIAISEYQIAQKTMRYYWNLVGFFGFFGAVISLSFNAPSSARGKNISRPIKKKP